MTDCNATEGEVCEHHKESSELTQLSDKALASGLGLLVFIALFIPVTYLMVEAYARMNDPDVVGDSAITMWFLTILAIALMVTVTVVLVIRMVYFTLEYVKLEREGLRKPTPRPDAAAVTEDSNSPH